jgi:hypothetical protein
MAEVFFPDKGEATTLKDEDLHLIAIENSGTYALQKAKHSTVEAEIIRNDKDAEFNDLTVGGDADFSGASSVSFLEGTWTPVVADASSSGNTGTFLNRDAYYQKIGKLATIVLDIRNLDTTGMTAGNDLFIRGLPFAARSVTNFTLQRGGGVALTDITYSGQSSISIDDNTDYFRIFNSVSAGVGANLLVSSVTSGQGDVFACFSYLTN